MGSAGVGGTGISVLTGFAATCLRSPSGPPVGCCGTVGIDFSAVCALVSSGTAGNTSVKSPFMMTLNLDVVQDTLVDASDWHRPGPGLEIAGSFPCSLARVRAPTLGSGLI